MSATSPNAEDQAHLIIYDRWVMVAGQAAYFAVIALLFIFYRPVVPTAPMTVWLLFAGCIFLYILLFDVTMFARNPSPDELLRFWRALDKRHTILFDMIAVGIIALMLPYGAEAHRLVTVAFCVGYVPLQMISDPENVSGNRFSIVSVLGAFVIYLLMQGEVYTHLLAVFMAIYGATLFYSSNVFRKVVVDALRNRRAAEAAMEEVAAERDAKTRFIATASHDLGQPLQAARLFSDQLADAPNDAVRLRTQAGLDRAIASAQQMLSHMLNHMRLEADAVTPHTRDVEIRHLVQRMAAQFAIQAAQNNIRIKTVYSKGSILTDMVLLERGIANLLQNAIVHSGADRILIGSRRRPDILQLWVIDNGVGIAGPDAATIFNDYTQGSNSQSPLKGGFGLGLSSVKRLAQLLGGDASLDPRWTSGAAFCIALPMNARFAP